MTGTVAIFSARLFDLQPEIRLLTGLEPVRARFALPSSARAVAGWGHKPTADRARRLAAEAGLPYLALEDGFLRSIRPGTATRSFSYVVDRTGIYYDARGPSDLEALIAASAGEDVPDDTLALLRQARLGKYNAGRALEPADRLPADGFVLVMDQTAGDASVPGALADAESFVAMLDAAIDRFGAGRCVVKTHPDVAAGLKRGHLADAARSRGVALLAADVDPAELFTRAAAVYTVSSLIGLEALIAGVPVRCFGVPFYAGWGLTEDEKPAPRRTARPTLAALVDAAYRRYCRYVDPWFREPSGLEATVAALCELKGRFKPGPRLVTGGLSAWKRQAVTPFLHRAAGPPVHLRSARRAEAFAARTGAAVALWGSAPAPSDPRQPHLRMEDGFLRSVGLGVEGAYPASLVLDDAGLYYDPTRPSGFEVLAGSAVFDPPLLARAAALRARIREARLSKYMVGAPARLPQVQGRLRILVPGQVETDASIRLGTLGVSTNTALLTAVRDRHPEAFILYKPHPDVAAGLRSGAVPEEVLRRAADLVVADASIADCLDWADRVETMTSLAGFEALVRDKPVAVFGRPFYTGWGLTEDLAPIPERRGRRLSVDELLAVALILYPAYVDPVTRTPATVEVVVRRLGEPMPRGTLAERLGAAGRTIRARLMNRLALGLQHRGRSG